MNTISLVSMFIYHKGPQKINIMNLQDLKKQQEAVNTTLFNECGLFFAFSDSQFNENKTPLKEGEKYVPVMGGGYVPKNSLNKLL